MWNGNNYGAYPYQQNSPYYSGYSAPVYQQGTSQPQSVNTNKLYAAGIDDVRCRQLPANSDYIFLDNDKPIVYRKTTDATGKMDIQVFKITPYQEEEKTENKVDLSKYVSIDEFLELKQQFEDIKSLLKSEPTKVSAKKQTTQEVKI